MMSRKFCEPLVIPEDKKKQVMEDWNFPRIVFWFNCRGDCYTEIDNKIVNIERKETNT